MPLTARLFFVAGALNMLLAAAFGAFGAHALKASLSPEMMAVYHTANQYHFYHSLGLLIAALLAAKWPASAPLKWSGWLMLVGILLFSGSLYLLSITGLPWLGAITPIGGMAFLGAWLLLMIAVARLQSPRNAV